MLLVGGAGLIGSALSIRLASQGHNVVVVDDLSVNNLHSDWDLGRPGVNRPLYEFLLQGRLSAMDMAGVQRLEANAADFQVLGEIVSREAPQVIVNLAAVSHASKSNKDPARAFMNGSMVLQSSLDAARASGVSRFVYLSSSMVVGDFPAETVDEGVDCQPLGIYGALKFGGEALVRAYSSSFGLEHVIVRPAAAYGPGCVGRRFIQASLESALGHQPISVPGDGDERVDFTYVDDLTHGLVLAMSSAAASNQTFHMTAGHARSLNEVVEIIQREIPTAEVVHRPRNSNVPKRGTLAIDKARSFLGYEPQVTLEEGISRYLGWYRGIQLSHPELLVLEEPVIND